MNEIIKTKNPNLNYIPPGCKRKETILIQLNNGKYFCTECKRSIDISTIYSIRFCPYCGCAVSGTKQLKTDYVPCACYISDRQVCMGTAEIEHCNCHGNRLKCSFYPSVIEKAKRMIESEVK